MKKCLIALFFIPLVIALSGCGDETDSRLTDSDVLCLKMIEAGGTCSSSSTTSTSTVTSTVTVTSTN